MNDAEFESVLRVLRGEAAELNDQAGDRFETTRAWREFLALRDGARRSRRRRYSFMAAAAALAVVAAAVIVAVLRIAGPGVSGTNLPVGPGDRHTPRHGYEQSAAARSYPRAVVARFPVSGVQVLTQDGHWLWAVQVVPPPGAVASRHFNLVKIDARTGRILLRMDVGRYPTVVAAANGVVWRTRPDQARQVARINPATGRVVLAVRLGGAGSCGYLTFVAGELWAECGSGKSDTVFLRLDPVTGRVLKWLGPVRGPIGFESAFTPTSVWYSDNYAGLNGIVAANGQRGFRTLAAHGAHPTSFVYTQSLVYAAGAVWAMTNDESVAKVDPATGHIERVFTYRNYDPAYQGELAFLTAGEGSLWFLHDGYSDGHRATSVLRVSMATGKALGQVEIAQGSCGQPCYQIYDTGGKIWVPSLTHLTAIDPGRMPF